MKFKVILTIDCLFEICYFSINFYSFRCPTPVLVYNAFYAYCFGPAALGLTF